LKNIELIYPLKTCNRVCYEGTKTIYAVSLGSRQYEHAELPSLVPSITDWTSSTSSLSGKSIHSIPSESLQISARIVASTANNNLAVVQVCGSANESDALSVNGHAFCKSFKLAGDKKTGLAFVEILACDGPTFAIVGSQQFPWSSAMSSALICSSGHSTEIMSSMRNKVFHSFNSFVCFFENMEWNYLCSLALIYNNRLS
jgi:hypothetical protein